MVTRRGFFGALAGIPVAVAAAAPTEQRTDAAELLRQIRALEDKAREMAKPRIVTVRVKLDDAQVAELQQKFLEKYYVHGFGTEQPRGFLNMK